MYNPIIHREFIGLLRSRKAQAALIALAAVFALLVVVRWPTDARVDLSGGTARQVLRVFGYGLLISLLLIVPAFPAASIVREKRRGTLALLLNSPMKPWSIYAGKLLGVIGFVLLLLTMSLPAAAACFAMGGIAPVGELLALYAILLLVVVQYTALALLVSSYANSADSALRITYGLVLVFAVLVMGPSWFLQPQSKFFEMLGPSLISIGMPEAATPRLLAILAEGAEWLRCVSPVPAVMEVLNQSDVAGVGRENSAGAPVRYAIMMCLTTAAFMLWTIARLNHRIFDRARARGLVTQEQRTDVRVARRLLFVVDPQKRKAGIRWFLNPVMVKEFRCRRFGRLHWLFRLVGACIVVSLFLTFISSTATGDWGVEKVGGWMVMLQVALIVLVTPAMAAGLISSERESGGWQLLQMTPLSAGRIIRGKLFSVVWILLVLLMATLPGYLVMMWIKPSISHQVVRVLICSAFTAVFAVLLSAAVSSFFRRTATATATSYAILIAICAGTMLVWLGRDAPFGHSTVQAVLTINPLAAALTVLRMENLDLTQYDLLPANWWIMGGASLVCLIVLVLQTWRLTRPQ